MLTPVLISLFIMFFGASALPQVGPYLPSNVTFNGTTSTLLGTWTATRTVTVHPSTIGHTTRSSSAVTPSATSFRPSPFVISAFKPNSQVHLLPLNAAGLKFWLGGNPAVYCPTNVEQLSLCPEGDVTGFWGSCSLSALVPGGQSVYASPDGSIGFTQAHSTFMPAGSEQCPMAITGNSRGSIFGVVVDAFGADGLMACPATSQNGDILWQVFAALNNATVPSGEASDCIEFEAIAALYNLRNDSAAAWQYT